MMPNLIHGLAHGGLLIQRGRGVDGRVCVSLFSRPYLVLDNELFSLVDLAEIKDDSLMVLLTDLFDRLHNHGQWLEGVGS
jgi:hypothetical protein